MQNQIQKYPFLLPLMGLLLGYAVTKTFGVVPGLDTVILGGSGIWVLGYFWGVWRGGKVFWLGLFHVGLGVFWVEKTQQGTIFSRSREGLADGRTVYALLEVRDSWMLGANGIKGTVHCLGMRELGGVVVPCEADLRVVIRGEAPVPPALGRYWVAADQLSEYSLPEVPGESNWRHIMRSVGISGYIRKSARWHWVPGSSAQISWVYRCRSACLVWLHDEFRRRLRKQHAGLVYAMLLGDKSGLDPSMEAQFGAAGLLHVLAVSGMHVALIMGALFWVFSGFGARGSPGIASLLVLLAAGWAYTFLTGSGAAVVRAMISATWMWLGKYSVGRRQSLLHVLAGSAYLQFLLDPPCVEQLGFQLSYLAVFGIGWLHPQIVNKLPALPKMGRWLGESSSLTLSATLFTLPLLLWQFQSFPTWFLVGNLLLLPLFSMSVYLTLACLSMGWIPLLGDGLYRLFDVGLDALLRILSSLQSLPLPQLFSLPMDVTDLILLFGLVWAFCNWIVHVWLGEGFFVNPKTTSPHKAKRWLVFMTLSFVALCVHLEWQRSARHRSNESFSITNGNQTILVKKVGHRLTLVGPWRNSRTKKFVWQKLQNYAEQNGVREVEWVNQLPL
jgi:ComEC/Rec2-related protein